MKLPMTPENLVIAEVLCATSDKLDWWRNPTGNATMPSGVKMRFGLGGLLGTPDWIAIERASGRAWFVEFKAPGEKPNLVAIDRHIRAKDFCPGPCRHERCHLVHQELCLRRARDSGAVGIFADCLDDILKELSP